jgi:hypothetical protein
MTFTSRCSAGLETVACSESGRWLCREPGCEWRRCEHWAIDQTVERYPCAPRAAVPSNRLSGPGIVDPD